MGSGSGSDFSPHSSTNAGFSESASDEVSGLEGGSAGSLKEEEERTDKLTNLGFREKVKERGLSDLGESLGDLWERRAEEGLGFRRRDIVEVCGGSRRREMGDCEL